jgi:putative RNA 2'-phosphotransferase
MPKTLVKTVNYIACHSPEEYGLFWDPGGVMPWKELYWALQEDPSLRFVRESHLKELCYLGLDLMFHLDEKLLRLNEGVPLPHYPLCEPPNRLFYACRLKQHPVISKHGLRPNGNRSFIPLVDEEDLALRIAQRRDPEPIVIQVEALKAKEAGLVFLKGGEGLYLTEHVPPEYAILPMIKKEDLEALQSKKKEERAIKSKGHPSPGSFDVEARYFQDPASEKGDRAKGKRKSKKGPTWKQESRKERNKRDL